MAQYIKQPSAWGSIGSGIGKGFAEQFPEELQRGRMAAGLKQFEQQAGGLTPLQQMARLYAIPGITPQMQQTFGELARYQNAAQAYNRLNNQAPPASEMPASAQIPGAKLPVAGPFQPPQPPPSASGFPLQSAPGPAVAESGPTAEGTLPIAPWTPEQRNRAISYYNNMGFLPDQSQQLAADDEMRARETGKVGKERYDILNKRRSEALDELSRQMQIKTQKPAEELAKITSGTMLANAQRGMERDLRLNPDLPISEIANKWSDKILGMSKAKDALKRLGETTGIENFVKGNENYNKLKQYGNVFRDANNSEEFKDLLIAKPFGLSQQGASTISNPMSPQLNKFVDTFPFAGKGQKMGMRTGVTIDPLKKEEHARKAAIGIEPLLRDNDSVLTVAREFSNRDPNFDQRAFFDQLTEDQEFLQLSERQKREIAEGPKDILPTWGDIKYLPWRR